MIAGTEGADRLTPKGTESLVESRIPAQRIGALVSIDMGQGALLSCAHALLYLAGRHCKHGRISLL
jgi:hypothetical protein